jgi:5,10-methylenetetrahydrofolate reductase
VVVGHFPPKDEQGERVLWSSLDKLAPLGPDFV